MQLVLLNPDSQTENFLSKPHVESIPYSCFEAHFTSVIILAHSFNEKIAKEEVNLGLFSC